MTTPFPGVIRTQVGYLHLSVVVGNNNSRNTAHTAFSSPRLTTEVDGAGPREWGLSAVSHTLPRFCMGFCSFRYVAFPQPEPGLQMTSFAIFQPWTRHSLLLSGGRKIPGQVSHWFSSQCIPTPCPVSLASGFKCMMDSSPHQSRDWTLAKQKRGDINVAPGGERGS